MQRCRFRFEEDGLEKSSVSQKKPGGGVPALREADGAAGADRGVSAARGVCAESLRVSAVLLMVRAGPGGESFLGGDGVCAAGVSCGSEGERSPTAGQGAHFLAEADS